MGHIKYGPLPATRPWNEVVGLIAGGASAAQIATATVTPPNAGSALPPTTGPSSRPTGCSSAFPSPPATRPSPWRSATAVWKSPATPTCLSWRSRSARPSTPGCPTTAGEPMSRRWPRPRASKPSTGLLTPARVACSGRGRPRSGTPLPGSPLPSSSACSPVLQPVRPQDPGLPAQQDAAPARRGGKEVAHPGRARAVRGRTPRPLPLGPTGRRRSAGSTRSGPARSCSRRWP
jgi:hypothetical protein